jgi:co-chaperonin GroES (HSP10)
MRVRPLFNNVVVRVDPPPTEGAIVLPDAWRTPPTEGVVLAVGPTVRELAAGDRVAWNHGSGEGVDLDDGARGLVLNESAILAVLG